MRNLDFLSEYPRTYIFEKDINKTNFGGVLFLIYAIIMLIISFSYILDFALNEKFEIEYLSINNQTISTDLEALDKDPDLNPTLEFKFLIPKESMYRDFRIILIKDGQPHVKEFLYLYEFEGHIKVGLPLNSTVSKFGAYLAFYCGNDSNCTINEEKEQIQENTSFEFEVWIGVPTISHQNSKKPNLDDDKVCYSTKLISDFKTFKGINIFYKVIKYKEKKGISRLFDKLLNLKTEYYTGHFGIDEVSDEEESWIDEIDGNYYKHLKGIFIENNHREYDLYKRRRITVLDVLSTISALFTPIRLVFLFIYGFYSKNFNNYKMIENILNQKYKNKKLLELKGISDKKDSSIKELNDNENQEILTKTDLIEKNDDNVEEINEKEDDDDSEFRLDKKERILPKYSFMQFFLNNIYCKSWKGCAKYEKQQEILEICNTINMKYLSLDSILYNQIMFENLLRDYNWNNSLLNNVKNNELILKLKTLIE